MSLESLARSANFRDLGGHVSADGRRVRSGELFRSGDLSRLRRSERAALEGLGIRTVIDLRTDAEVARRGATFVPRSGRVVRLPIDSGDLTSRLIPTILRGDFDAVPTDLLERINRQIVREATPQLREAIALVAHREARPVLFHCTHGKDRAGVLAMLLLLALDVPWPQALADYLRSNEQRCADNRRQFWLLRRIAPLLSRRVVRRADLDAVARLFLVVPENLEAARAEMEARHGSIDAYFAEALGCDARRLAELRDALLSNGSAERVR